MLSFQEALDRLLAAAVPVSETRLQPLTAAAGRVLAVPQFSAVAAPPLDNPGMDGYAVRCADVAAGICLPVSQRIPASPATHSSCMTTASAPGGTGAPVKMRAAVPGCRGAPTVPAGMRWLTGRQMPAATSAHRTA